jgi:ABC-type transport system substrate-binding protein
VLDREVCTAVAGQLAKVGLQGADASVGDYPPYESRTGEARLRHDHARLRGPAAWRRTGPCTHLAFLQRRKNFNWADYSNPRVDALIDVGRTTVAREKRRAAYAEIQKIVMQEPSHLQLYAEHEFTGIRKGVTGVFMRPDQALLLLAGGARALAPGVLGYGLRRLAAPSPSSSPSRCSSSHAPRRARGSRARPSAHGRHR